MGNITLKGLLNLMKFKQFNDDKLILLGQDSLTLFTGNILNTGLLEEFSHGLANIELNVNLREEIGFKYGFDDSYHYDYILYHMVMFGATIMKFSTSSYIKKKKLFGGYNENLFGAFKFSQSLEYGLDNFKKRGNFINIKSVIPNLTLSGITYSLGDTLDKYPFPYFWLEHSQKSLDEMTTDFATNIASIRQPENPNIVIGVFYEKAKEILPICHKILHGLFIE